MFFVGNQRLHPHPVRSDATSFRDSDSFQDPGPEYAAHVPRDSGLLLSPHTGYISGRSLDRDYSERQDDSATSGSFVRPRTYSDATGSNVLHGSYSPIAPSSHYRYPGSMQHLHSTDEVAYHSQQPEIGQPLLPTLPQIGREDLTSTMDTSILVHNYSPEPQSSMTASPSTHSSFGDSEAWRSSSKKPLPETPLRPRKTRREKPRIQLAPDQPPTTQGKPRARVYVACIQCRTRKIRCDGAKPVCHNCGRRSSGSGECSYDAAPKRRGPDKTPGARQRMARDLRNELAGSIGPTRRQRRRREDELTRSDGYSIGRRSASMSEPARHNGPQVPSAWPLCLSPISTISNDALSTAGECLSDHGLSQRHPKPGQLANCGCPVSSVYGLEFAERGDHVHAPARLVSQDYNQYAQSFDATTSNHMGGGYITVASDEYKNESESLLHIAPEPSVDFRRKIWWDSLLSFYTSASSHQPALLNASQREVVSRSITDDLRFLFKSSNSWFSFFHVPTFFANYLDQQKRDRMQPSLVLAALAVSTFWQSSEIGGGRAGRERALRFRDEAQTALEASFNARWIDETLAQAAWLLALFEICAHPLHSTERATASMVMLDSIIRSLSLTCIDSGHPAISVFSPRSVPTVPSSAEQRTPTRSWSNPEPSSHTSISLIADPSSISGFSTPTPSHPDPSGSSTSVPQGCVCHSLSLGEYWPRALDHTPLWTATPTWDRNWTEGDIRKESCRRLCWSSMVLAAAHNSYSTANKGMGLDLFISDPANYALLFSGESVFRSVSGLPSGYSPKETVWALYDRSMLLWHSCVRMRQDRVATETEKAHFAIAAWLEADVIEAALDKHTCNLERAFIFQGREYLFNTRMCVTYEFQRSMPVVNIDVNGLHRKKAEEWLTHQTTVAKRFMYGLSHVTGMASNLLARRPFFVFWFMGQISRALYLWDCDHTLTAALECGKAFLPPIDYLAALWPCDEQRTRYEALRERLANVCFVAGIPPLSSPLPSSSNNII